MDHLLALLTTEQAKELQFRAGTPPIMVSESEQRPLQGPPITGDDVAQLLRGVAASRHLRDLREKGHVQFVYTPRGRTPFLIRAKIEGENLQFDISQPQHELFTGTRR